MTVEEAEEERIGEFGDICSPPPPLKCMRECVSIARRVAHPRFSPHTHAQRAHNCLTDTHTQPPTQPPTQVLKPLP